MNQRYTTELRDERLNIKVTEQSSLCGLSKKEYVSKCCEFFALRQINPEQYDPKNDVELQLELRTGVDLILKQLQDMNSNVIKDVAHEVIHSRLWLEAISTQFTELLVKDEEKENVTKSILEYFNENLKERAR